MSMAVITNHRLHQRYNTLGTLATWIGPAVAIPTLRLMQDSSESRWRLFSRDFSTYSVGAGLYFLFAGLTSRLLKNRIADHGQRNLYAVCAGVVANILFAGLGAPHVYRVLEAFRPKPQQPPPRALNPAIQAPLRRSYPYARIQTAPVVRSATFLKPGGRQYGFEQFG